MAKSFTQRKGIDFKKNFSHVVKFKIIGMMLAIIVQFDLELEQLYIKIAFLHGELNEQI